MSAREHKYPTPGGGIRGSRMTQHTPAILKTDQPFDDSPNTGHPDCICSRCSSPIPAGEIAVRVWPDGDTEYRYHPHCVMKAPARPLDRPDPHVSNGVGLVEYTPPGFVNPIIRKFKIENFISVDSVEFKYRCRAFSYTSIKLRARNGGTYNRCAEESPEEIRRRVREASQCLP